MVMQPRPEVGKIIGNRGEIVADRRAGRNVRAGAFFG